ncbi:MAG TPA: NAD(P)/FAD-dependent oxidoreductase, partial [Pseudolabrys sp.]|nr:NAD(P)/FAD-dependent oxidoreductase [Pseudolabrys sp.]
MRRIDVVIVGGGQAGLAMSRSLTAEGVDHVVLERGRIGERWHSERWRSLHLLTTRAMSALPGLPHDGDPDGFMPASAFASYLSSYARKIDAPVFGGVEVTRVEPTACGYRIATTAGDWQSRALVIATGACDTPFRPTTASLLPASIAQISPATYWEPGQLPPGGVLVVGASSTGVQLAEEIHASGRPVVLSVGDHTRVPRRYRGRDIYAWMEASGMLDETVAESANIDYARRQPSLQVIGRRDNRDIHLGILRDQGIRLVGRFAGIGGGSAAFDGDLEKTTAAAHKRMLRCLDRIDAHIVDHDLQTAAADPAARVPFPAQGDAVTLDLTREGIRSVVWATGYVRRYPWLKAPVLD